MKTEQLTVRVFELAGQTSKLEEAIVMLERVIDLRMANLQMLTDERFIQTTATLEAADRAVTKAETASDKRFDSVNEFRATLADQVGRFVTRDTVDIMASSTRERVEALTRANTKLIEENRTTIDDMAERTRQQLDDVKAQATRLLFALMSTVLGTLVAALIVAWSTH